MEGLGVSWKVPVIVFLTLFFTFLTVVNKL